jgi:sugar/nucleoside kinase (ribokinase family)
VNSPPPGASPVLVVGSIALDTIRTPAAERRDILGGSASYAAVAASLLAPVRLVGVVGEDFPSEHRDLFASCAIDLEGLEVQPGTTFRWSGVYEQDMNVRRTLSTCLNVFEGFDPRIPETYRNTEYVLLGNIAPALQSRVLDALTAPRMVVADTMNLWIDTAREDLLDLLQRVHILTLNDEEARMLTGRSNLLAAARNVLQLGPETVIVKKGEHGSLVVRRDGEIFCAPGFPLDEVHDPTGAGDAFAGGLTGWLASSGDDSPASVRRAVVAGAVIASFVVQGFSLEALHGKTRADIDTRIDAYLDMARL